MPRGRPYRPLSLQEIQQTSRAIVAVLSSNGLKSCLFGSAACLMHGMSRTPNDVDVIVLDLWESWSVEDLKDLIVRSDERFYVTQTRNPWTILWYNLHPLRSGRRCKVDILVPGLLDIPQMPLSRITYTTVMPNVPTMPLLALILLKLKGWDDHRHEDNQDKYEKQFVDVEDIDELLEIAIEEHDCHLKTEKWMPGWFKDNARSRVKDFIVDYPDTAERWEELGF